MCCEGVRIGDIPKIKERRCQKRKEKTELSSAETEGGACSSSASAGSSLTLSAGQLALFFETGE